MPWRPTGKAEAGAVDGVAEGAVLAGAQPVAALAERVRRTGSGARLAVPAGAAIAPARPRMTPSPERAK